MGREGGHRGGRRRREPDETADRGGRIVFQQTPGHGQGTPTPGANPDGYTLGPDDGSLTWSAKGLISCKAKYADARGILSFFGVELFRVTEGSSFSQGKKARVGYHEQFRCS